MIADDDLKDFHQFLQRRLKKEADISQVLRPVYRLVDFVLTDSESRSGDGDRTIVGVDQFMKNAERHNQFFETLRRAANSPLNREALEALIFHSAFWTTPSESEFAMQVEPPVVKASLESQNQAIEDSWNADFIDLSPLDGLVQHISSQLGTADYMGATVQLSSHLGWASRACWTNFLSIFFMIPINLRPTDTTGYPPPDNVVRDFLTRNSHRDSYYEEIGRRSIYPDQTVREFMSKDQHMGAAGLGRLDFYKGVVSLAQTSSKSRHHKPPNDQELSEKLEELRSVLKYNATGSGQPEEPQAKGRYPDRICAAGFSDRFVDIFIAFTRPTR
ncbi:hypothetical protein BJV78DRAFT_1152633 [Lactifluus subvellereus]|nr:hypothetical protein BJV78DRAFT_1152633 [Lactifluus subvellereus]